MKKVLTFFGAFLLGFTLLVQAPETAQAGPAFDDADPALVVNFGRDGLRCTVVSGRNVVGIGQNGTRVRNDGGRFLRTCHGDWIGNIPSRARNTNVRCGAVIGRITITPSGEFSLTCRS